ncbi:hypothetical protein HY732_05285 [Candidatus Uhrbacteria bacterium]|nr:hypothetical protein [Candidatus Uhrbacteria bacterium]
MRIPLRVVREGGHRYREFLQQLLQKSDIDALASHPWSDQASRGGTTQAVVGRAPSFS